MEAETGSVRTGPCSGGKASLRQTGGLIFYSTKGIFLLYDDVGLLCSLSEPHGGRFDADDAERRPVSRRAATRQPVSLEKLLILHKDTANVKHFRRKLELL